MYPCVSGSRNERRLDCSFRERRESRKLGGWKPGTLSRLLCACLVFVTGRGQCLWACLCVGTRELDPGTSLLVQWLRISASNEAGAGSILGRGAESLHAWWSKNQNINQKQYCNKFNENFKNGPYQKKVTKDGDPLVSRPPPLSIPWGSAWVVWGRRGTRTGQEGNPSCLCVSLQGLLPDFLTEEIEQSFPYSLNCKYLFFFFSECGTCESKDQSSGVNYLIQ